MVTLNLLFFHRYSGEHREIGEAIDDAANITWDNVSISVNYKNISLYC